jgi:hypothetical protein
VDSRFQFSEPSAAFDNFLDFVCYWFESEIEIPDRSESDLVPEPLRLFHAAMSAAQFGGRPLLDRAVPRLKALEDIVVTHDHCVIGSHDATGQTLCSIVGTDPYVVEFDLENHRFAVNASLKSFLVRLGLRTIASTSQLWGPVAGFEDHVRTTLLQTTSGTDVSWLLSEPVPLSISPDLPGDPVSSLDMPLERVWLIENDTVLVYHHETHDALVTSARRDEDLKSLIDRFGETPITGLGFRTRVGANHYDSWIVDVEADGSAVVRFRTDEAVVEASEVDILVWASHFQTGLDDQVSSRNVGVPTFTVRRSGIPGSFRPLQPRVAAAFLGEVVAKRYRASEGFEAAWFEHRPSFIP